MITFVVWMFHMTEEQPEYSYPTFTVAVVMP